MQVRRSLPQRHRRPPPVIARRRQHGTGLRPDVRRPPCGPVKESGRDHVQRVFAAQVHARRGDLRDARRHLRVVRKLARRIRSQPAADHGGHLAGAQLAGELIRDAERITARRAEQHPRRAVKLLRRQPPGLPGPVGA